MTPGTYNNFNLSFPAAGNVNVPSSSGFIGSVIITNPGGQTSQVNLNYDSLTGLITTSPISYTIACLHGNSIITTTNGDKFIKNAEIGDKVLTANGAYAEVLNVCQ